MPTDPRDARIAEIRYRLEVYDVAEAELKAIRDGYLKPTTGYHDACARATMAARDIEDNAPEMIREVLTAEAEARETIARLTDDWREQDAAIQRILTVTQADDEHVSDIASAVKAIEAAIQLRQQQADATVVRLEQERDAAMEVLDPNVPESGLEDAARQVKQVAISAMDNCEKCEALLEQADAARASLHAALRTYGQHKRGCAVTTPRTIVVRMGQSFEDMLPPANAVCDCGLMAALLPSPQERTP